MAVVLRRRLSAQPLDGLPVLGFFGTASPDFRLRLHLACRPLRITPFSF
jgi:hypothetical protein